MFKFLWLSTSYRINKHENYLNYLASVCIGFTLSTQGDSLCVSVKCVEALIVKGKSTTAQLEEEQNCTT